jgi:malonate decarboxylase alpha subunit
MAKQILEPVSLSWTTRRDEKRRRIEQVKPWMKGSILPEEKIIELSKPSSSTATGN